MQPVCFILRLFVKQMPGKHTHVAESADFDLLLAANEANNLNFKPT